MSATIQSRLETWNVRVSVVIVLLATLSTIYIVAAFLSWAGFRLISNISACYAGGLPLLTSWIFENVGNDSRNMGMLATLMVPWLILLLNTCLQYGRTERSFSVKQFLLSLAVFASVEVFIVIALCYGIALPYIGKYMLLDGGAYGTPLFSKLLEVLMYVLISVNGIVVATVGVKIIFGGHRCRRSN